MSGWVSSNVLDSFLAHASDLKPKVSHVAAARSWRQAMQLLHHPGTHTKSIYTFNGAITAYLGRRPQASQVSASLVPKPMWFRP